MATTNTAVKRSNPARHERLNKDWPIKVYSYDCWPQEKPPQALWDTAHQMRRLWNEFTAIFRNVLAADKKDESGKPLLSRESRAALWSAINTKALREIGKQYRDALDIGCREAVVVRFLTTVGNWRKNPSRFGAPRFQRADEMDSINIPLIYNEGKSAQWLIDGNGTSSVRDTLRLKNKAPQEYLNNGHFCVGITRERLNLHIAYGGRSGRNRYFLPDNCRIKQVALCGKRDSAFGWSWSFQVRLEHPPDPPRQPTGRVCGWDSGGWRLMNGYIRLGVIADNAGHFYELTLPLAIGECSRKIRREVEYCKKQGWEYAKPISFEDAEELEARYGLAVEACKTQIRKIYDEEKGNWPEEARKIMSGIVKMRDTGLRRLRRKLEPIESEAKRTIDDWDAEAAKMNETMRAFEIHASRVKRDTYYQIAAWLDAFDIIAWEGDLSLKQMAEEVGRKKQKRKEDYEKDGQWNERTPEERQLEASQKYRQIAGQYQLRLRVKQKQAVRLLEEKSAYSTQTCPECGAHIEPGGKLLLVCKNGHRRDQDVSASVYFLNKIEGATRITAPPVEIPLHLQRYLRVMDVSEVRLEIIDT